MDFRGDVLGKNDPGVFLVVGSSQLMILCRCFIGRRFVGLLPRMFKLMAMSQFVSQLRDMGASMPDKKECMALMKELLESGELTPYIDRTYPLSEVPEAIRYLQEGRAKGKIVITV